MRKLLPYALILLLVACVDQTPPPPPDNALDKEKFVEVMVDVHLVEAAINQKFIKVNDSTQASYRYYKHLFEKHEINRTDFDSTFNYYMRHPKLMSEIYIQVHDSLQALSDDLNENEEKYQRMELDSARGDTSGLDLGEE